MKTPILHSPRNVLVTGGSGFIGCNFVRHLLHTDNNVKVINVDALTYAGHPANLEDVEQGFKDRYFFVHTNICDADSIKRVFEDFEIDTVVHFAAESHVDRSIDGPLTFVDTNILGTAVLLERARAYWQNKPQVRFHHVSTDEVFGSLQDEGFFTEETPYDPSSPYSASKAASDHLVRAWHRTYELPVTISNCSNNYGPFQFPEKLIPLMILNALKGKSLPVYGDGLNIRDWLHVRDHCRAIWDVIQYGRDGYTYNIGGLNEQSNIDVVYEICDLLDQKQPLEEGKIRRDLISFVTDRPGHDRRYAIDASRICRELEWKPQFSFKEGLCQTVDWYLKNIRWCKTVSENRYDGQRLGIK